MGSKRAARIAGRKLAASATAASSAIDSPIVIGSVGFNPNSIELVVRAAAIAKPVPIASPASSSIVASRKTNPSTFARFAPRAIRMPISLRRRATM